MLQGQGTASSLHILYLLPSSAFPQGKEKKNLHTLQIENGQFLSKDPFRLLWIASVIWEVPRNYCSEAIKANCSRTDNGHM